MVEGETGRVVGRVDVRTDVGFLCVLCCAILFISINSRRGWFLFVLLFCGSALR